MPIKSKSKPKQYEVEKILDKKVEGMLVSYKVKWVGYKQTTWEDAANLASCKELVRAFEKEYTKKQKKKREARSAFEVFEASTSTVAGNEDELLAEPDPIHPEVEETIKQEMPPGLIPAKIWGSSKDSAGDLFFAVEFKPRASGDNQNWEPELEPPQEEEQEAVLVREREGPPPGRNMILMSGAAMKKYCPLFLIEYYERHTVFLNSSQQPISIAAADEED